MFLQISYEVPVSLELKLVVRLRVRERVLDERAQHLLAVRIQQRAKVAFAGVGVGVGEEAIEHAHFGGDARGHGQPVDRGLGLYAVLAG